MTHGVHPSGRPASVRKWRASEVVCGMDEVSRRDRMVELLANLTDHVVAEIDADGVIGVASRSAPPPLAYAMGASWFETVSDPHRATLRAALRAVLDTGTTTSFQAEAPGPDGSERQVAIRLARLPPHGGAPSAVVVCREVTGGAEATGTPTDEQLEETDRVESVRAFAAGLAHEINNPLAAVIANLDLALRDGTALSARVPLPSDFLEEIKDAREGAERVRVIMRDLRLFAAPDSDRLAAVDMRRVLESALRMSWNELRHRARLVKLYGPVPPVEANEARLGQVFFALVLHLARELPVGHADRHEVRVITAVEDEQVVVTLAARATSDPDVQLGPFVEPTSAPTSRTPRAHALVAARRVVEPLGGSVEVASSPPASAFRVRLPLARSEPTAEVPAPTRAARRGRVLLIDDEPMVGVVVRRTLGAEHDVIALTSASAALALLGAGEDFDVILCDVMMPQMTGVELYETLVERLPHLAPRVVFLTGGTFTGREADFLDASTNPCLEKPFEHVQLRALVNDRIR